MDITYFWSIGHTEYLPRLMLPSRPTNPKPSHFFYTFRSRLFPVLYCRTPNILMHGRVENDCSFRYCFEMNLSKYLGIIYGYRLLKGNLNMLIRVLEPILQTRLNSDLDNHYNMLRNINIIYFMYKLIRENLVHILRKINVLSA